MTHPGSHPLDNAWPPHDLEAISACPYCGRGNQALAYQNVKDWLFGSAASRWNYWRCSDCHALLLNPRPDTRSIGRAYGRYYTHGAAPRPTLLAAIKQRLRNECWSQLFATPVLPPVGMPRWASPIFRLFTPWVAEPFGLRQLAELPKGVLIDVGCGNGDTVKLAAQLGWQARGIELDAAAIRAAQARGLDVMEGSYEVLSLHEGQADCLICSHVIEHVHQPLRLLRLLLAALKPQGVLLLSAPNAASHLSDRYGENWRGLEAPRHLAIPDATWLIGWLRAEGFRCRQSLSHDVVTVIESERIARRALVTTPFDVRAGKKIARAIARPAMDKQDILQIVCTRERP